MNPDEVRSHWEDWAERYEDDLRATTRAPTAKRLEIDALLRALGRHGYARETPARVLEVGCGNGHNALAIAEAFTRFEIVGIDYIAKMVESARHNASRSPGAERISFHEGDVTDLAALAALDDRYDVIVSNRCLINLGSDERQLTTLVDLASRVADDGVLLMIENSQQAFARQNACRESLGLPARSPSEFNHFLDEEKIMPALERCFDEVSTEDFGSLHDLVLYVLLPAIQDGQVDYAHPLVEATTDFLLNPPESVGRPFGALGQNRLFVASRPRRGAAAE